MLHHGLEEVRRLGQREAARFMVDAVHFARYLAQQSQGVEMALHEFGRIVYDPRLFAQLHHVLQQAAHTLRCGHVVRLELVGLFEHALVIHRPFHGCV